MDGTPIVLALKFPAVMATEPYIIHCDCDSFYASIEERDNAALAGKPIAVGGLPEQRGVIATCNYVARKFGIHSAMPSATARRRCANLIIIRPDMEKYRRVSRQVHEIFRRYTRTIEPLSLDEAYLDVRGCADFGGDAIRIAEAIRAAVRNEIGITISAGIAGNKLLAKIASDWNKPDGQFVVKPEQVADFIARLPVSHLHGVGKVTAAKLRRLNMETCGDLQKMAREELRERFGRFGQRLYEQCRGIDNRPVQVSRVRKSVSVETTYAKDLPDLQACLDELPGLIEQLQRRLERMSKPPRINKQVVKIKFHDFSQTTAEMLSTSLDLENYSRLCETGFRRGGKPVRLLGVGVRLPEPEN